MKVGRRSLEDIPVSRLVVIDPETSSRHEGEMVAYRCDLCGAADETLRQIWHEDDCDLVGEHGREFYDDLVPDVPDQGPTPEFDPEHPITVIQAGESAQDCGIHNYDVLGFECACGNADEDVFEIVHDDKCGLAHSERKAEDRLLSGGV